MDSDPGIRVSVLPAQSAFFAGESFSISVTFTNTRVPSSSAKRPVSRSHKRAAHSISSAPLARPPTSPVTPRTAIPPIRSSAREATRTKKKYERKGLIGVPASSDNINDESRTISALEQRNNRFLSTAISSQEVASVLSSSTSSTTPPLRDASLPANHPHARKHSVQDVQLEAQLQLKELSSPALAPSGSASTSAFSLSLDTISEHNSDSTHQYPPRRRPPQLGLGLGPPPHGTDQRQPPHSAFPSTFAQPGTEIVLYAYAQLSGSVTLGSDTVQSESRAQAQALNAVRLALQKKQAFGGGRMDISSSLDTNHTEETHQRHTRVHPNGHTRASSLSSSIMSLLSPPAPSNQGWTPGHKARSPSLIASLISPSVSSPASIGSSYAAEVVEEVPAETPLPTFEVQPAMLAVDLVLGAGESRTYTYTLPLPANLPPTYRGRVVKFAYHLVVGVCRASPGRSPSSTTGRSSTSQVMRVPIRIYNHVDVSVPQQPYDLLWSVLRPPGKEQTAQVNEMLSSPGSGKRRGKSIGSPSLSPSQALPKTGEIDKDPKADLRAYALRLLNSLPDESGEGGRLPVEIEALSPTGGEPEREIRGRGGGELTGCREAVEILTRNMRKVSYDVNKDGVKVAVLTFTKSAYRLGETVIGVVELNDTSSRARVLKLSAMLEAHETLPSSLCPSSTSQGGSGSGSGSGAPKKTRKLHAEYHAALTVSTVRTSFALDIPSDGAPAFRYGCASPSPSPPSSHLPPPSASSRSASGSSKGVDGGLTWAVRLCLLVGVTSENARRYVDGRRTKGLVRDGPRGEWGTAWRATRGIAPLQCLDPSKERRRTGRGRGGYFGSAPTSTDTDTDSSSRSGVSEREQQELQKQKQRGGWASYFLSGLLTPGEREYHDGDEEPPSPSSSPHSDLRRSPSTGGDEGEDEDEDEVDLGGGEEGWAELRAETVECEVPIRVWPGNTAFRPVEVVFEV